MRTNYSVKNFILQFITNITTVIFLFASQTIFIKLLGVEYNGLNGLFTNILTILNLFELGIGSSITYNLYKYTKNNDEENIKSIMSFYRKAYNYICILVLFIGLLFIPFLKYIVKDITIDINILFVYLLFVITTISSYLFSYKRSIIVANQKNYIINIIEIIYIIILNTLQILILWFTKNYYLYLIIKILCILIENIIINIKASKMYPYLLDKNIKSIDPKIKESIVSRVKALVIHKTSGAVTNGTDNILISAFLGITTTGLYTSYNYIISSVKKLFGNIIQATTSSIGNLLTENNYEKNYETFKKIRFLNLWIAIFTSTCLLLITQPFVKLWLGKKYLLDISVLIVLVINYFQTMMRSTYATFKDAAGIWIEDKYIPILQLSINIISSIILLKLFGLKGVFIGTILSSLVLWFYSYPFLVYKKLFNKSIKSYIKDFISHILLFVIILGISFSIYLYKESIVISLIVSIIIPNILLFIIYRNKAEFKYYKSLIKKSIKR